MLVIRRFRARNYRSLADIDVPLGKFTVLLGPNASGKSNLLDALGLIPHMLKGETTANAIAQRGGWDAVRFFGAAKNSPVEIALSGTWREHEFEYSIAFTHEGICKESLVLDEREIALAPWGAKTASFSPALCSSTEPPASEFRKELTAASFKLRPESTLRVGSGAKGLLLEQDSSGLAPFLGHVILEHPNVHREIEEAAKSAMPWVASVRAKVRPSWKLELRDVAFPDMPLDDSQVSDGTRLLLAFLCILHSPDIPSFVCFEEPENFLHPRLAEFVVDMMRTAPAQVIVSTHSPLLVSYAKPEELAVLHRDKGRTICRALSELDAEKLKHIQTSIREGLSLGEQWFSGELDDMCSESHKEDKQSGAAGD